MVPASKNTTQVPEERSTARLSAAHHWGRADIPDAFGIDNFFKPRIFYLWVACHIVTTSKSEGRYPVMPNYRGSVRWNRHRGDRNRYERVPWAEIAAETVWRGGTAC